MKKLYFFFVFLYCSRLIIPPKPDNVYDGAVYIRKLKIWEFKSEKIELLWTKEGEILKKANLKNALYNGEFVSYFENGTISEKGFYEDGFRVGKWYFYYPNGTIYLEIEYKKEPYDPNIFVLNSSFGNENGIYKRYYPDGTLEEEGYYFAGKFHQKRIRYYKNKKIHFISFYSYGKKEGTWKYFDTNQKLIREEIYQDDQLIQIKRF